MHRPASLHVGDLHQEKCIEQARNEAGSFGAPCETWTAARHRPPPAEHVGRWPRSLRSALRGLLVVNFYNVDRVHSLPCKPCGPWRCTSTPAGLFISGHPGLPRDAEHASVWRTALVELLRQDPEVRLHHVGQWRFGAPAVKPTDLLTYHLPRFLSDLYQHEDPAAVRPRTEAIGVDPDTGKFRTSSLKDFVL